MKYHYVLSEKCNMNCMYCNVDKQSTRKLSNDDFDKYYATLDADNFEFDIFGGEPFLFLNEVKYIINILSNDPRCSKINITTNGTIVHRDIISIANNSKVNLTLSCDGIYQMEHRGQIPAIDFYKSLINQVHCMIHPNDLITDYSLIDQHNWLEALSPKIDMVLLRDRNIWSEKDLGIFRTNYANYLVMITSNLSSYDKFSKLPGLFRDYLSPILEYHTSGIVASTCGINTGEYKSFINNEHISCERFTRTNDEYKLINLRKYLDICNGCNIRHYCNRGCLYEQIQNDGPISELCSIYRIIFQEIKEVLCNKYITRHLILLKNEAE